MPNQTDKPFLSVLKGRPNTPPPIWLMRQAGRYLPEYREVRASCRDFLDLCYTPKKAVEVTLQPLRRFDLDAAILFSDILVIADALGCKVAFKEGEGPVLRKIANARDLAGLTSGKVISRLAPVFETVSGIKAALPTATSLIGFAGAPWTVASYMVEGHGSKDFAAVKRLSFTEPDTFQALIDLLVETTADYLCAQIEAGAEALQLFDSWAGLLAEKDFERWVIEPTKLLVEKIKSKYPDVPIIGFAKGAGLYLTDYAKRTGVDALAIDVGVPISWAAQTLGREKAIQGNLDPVLLSAGGEAMDREIDRILAATKDVPFVFNLGHGILPQTAPENVKRLVERVRRSGNRP